MSKPFTILAYNSNFIITYQHVPHAWVVFINKSTVTKIDHLIHSSSITKPPIHTSSHETTHSHKQSSNHHSNKQSQNSPFKQAVTKPSIHTSSQQTTHSYKQSPNHHSHSHQTTIHTSSHQTTHSHKLSPSTIHTSSHHHSHKQSPNHPFSHQITHSHKQLPNHHLHSHQTTHSHKQSPNYPFIQEVLKPPFTQSPNHHSHSHQTTHSHKLSPNHPCIQAVTKPPFIVTKPSIHTSCHQTTHSHKLSPNHPFTQRTVANSDMHMTSSNVLERWGPWSHVKVLCADKAVLCICKMQWQPETVMTGRPFPVPQTATTSTGEDTTPAGCTRFDRTACCSWTMCTVRC